MAKRESSEDRIVYSTGVGRRCPECGQPKANCRCRPGRSAGPGDGNVRIRRETKGRGGKTVTTISGLPLEADALKLLGAELRRLCGTGGSVKNGMIEIQGEHRDRLLEALRARGFAAKRAGG